MDLVPVRKITVHQAEGWTENCTTREYSGFSGAARDLMTVCHEAPKDGSYLKCDVSVEWSREPGHPDYTWEFRFDAKEEELGEAACLGHHIKRAFEFYLGERRPDWMTKEQYDRRIAEIWKDHPDFIEGIFQMFFNCKFED